ncbi:hypothetical protein CS022_15175 [Veronia nyctiphanis]|uniref:DUF423 domain-containing protein n=1 Tax=Veronia nyctiphanis TaxID=1278244 RepID=A0A4Q0YNS2_9GAMM|nr:DUF423 domain-containing protein [Veronia nyctiphanis]RXJ72526.1 hypothetical protein CS022_15175 [Veronia nyctiphanis]
MRATKIIALGCVFSALSVMIGAFAAHGLKAHLSDYSLSIIRTGVQYQFWHSLALLALGSVLLRIDAPRLILSAKLLVAGIVFFSGSLYGLALTGANWLGPITPIGGVFFIAGWLIAAWSLWRHE